MLGVGTVAKLRFVKDFATSIIYILDGNDRKDPHNFLRQTKCASICLLHSDVNRKKLRA